MDDVRRVETSEWSGLTNVIWHEYFGSPKVVQDLAKLPGWSEGRISVGNRISVGTVVGSNRMLRAVFRWLC